MRSKNSLCQKIPDEVTFEEASSWPLTLGIPYQALVRTANLQPGKSVLIQGASSPIGQASIHLAKSYGATIFATVNTQEQSILVEGLGVPKKHVLNGGDPNLAAIITRLSYGKGIDVIINNSTSSEVIRRLWHCISSFGVFVDISGSDVLENSALDMLPFQRGASFSVLKMDLIIKENPSLMAVILAGLSESMKNKWFKSSSPLKVLPAGRVADAFEILQRQGETERVVVSFNNQDIIPVSPAASNQLYLESTATYLIAGGLGGLGRSLARLLVENGARHLVFLSRSGATSANAHAMIQELNLLGATVKAYACDISDETAMESVIAQCSIDMPPILGAIQSAAVLNDSIYDNMTYEQWQAAIKPKIQGSWLLHQLLPKNLDFFVMLSSIAGVVGNRGQANYAAGNTYQDALASFRRTQGLPAVSVDLGLMLNIGLIAERGGATNLRKWEAVGINEVQFHAIMKAAMVGSFGQRTVPTQLISGLPTGGIVQKGSLEVPFYFNDPRFSLLKSKDVDRNETEDGDTAETDSLPSQLAQSRSIHEASRLIGAALCDRIAKGLQTSSENIDSSKPLHVYGVDSLMAVDIRTWILAHIRAEISLFDVLSSLAIAALATKIAGISKLVPQGLE
jgi:zearalenone synthase (highly reducing iterative type I polyketide synthase)